MKCEEARLEIGADPATASPALEAHVQGCDDCRGYQREMRRLEDDLRRALDWPRGETVGGGLPARDNVVPLRTAAGGEPAAAVSPSSGAAAATGGARAAGSHASTHGAPVPAARRWAFAAGVLLVGVLAASFLALQPRDALAAEVVAHMSEEPEAWTARRPVPQSALDLVLRRSGVRLDRVAAGEVVYAHSCDLRGRQVPHLVVATPEGPVTVLVLRGEKVPRRETFDEGGYRGVLMPVPGGGGGIAVLTRDPAGRAGDVGPDMEAAASRVLGALAWDVDAESGSR